MNLIKKTLRDALKTPGFSLLYIVGVAFTIAFTIIYGMLLYAQLGPVYPEYDRDRTVYVHTLIVTENHNRSSSSLARCFIDEFMRDKLKSADELTAFTIWGRGYPMVQTDGHGPEFHVEIRYVEPSFFNFYKYEFKQGKPFSQEDFESALHVADISEGVAKRLFGSSEEAIGKDISIDNVPFRVRGVFREGSALNVDSYAEVFLPYTLAVDGNNRQPGMRGYFGGLRAAIKVKSGKEAELRDELRDIERRINALDTTEEKFHMPGVMTHAEHVLTDTNVEFKDDDDSYQIKDATPLSEMWRPFFIALLVVLVIPALNISGLIGARMDRMASELGVRRCFGANRHRLMDMVLRENLVLTLAGGILGLVAAWLISVFAGSFLLQLTPLAYDSAFALGSNASFITGETAFAPLLFLFALVICVALNLLSAWIPARRALRTQITESLNSKR